MGCLASEFMSHFVRNPPKELRALSGLTRGGFQERHLDGKANEESIVAPRDGQPGGYVLTYLYDATKATTDLLILGVDDIASDPVAIMHLPVRVPVGLHGSWLPGEPMP